MALPQGLLLLTVVQLALGIGLVFGVAARWFLPRFDVEVEDQAVAQALAMLTVLMMTGYVLAAARVLNLAVLTAVLWGIRWFFYRRERQDIRMLWVAEDLYSTLERIGHRLRAWGGRSRSGSWRPSLGMLLTAAVLGLSAWIRFDFNWTHAALPFSDAYETLSWMKSIEHGMLFPNGLYPQGEYIVMAILHRFTRTSAIPFDKLFGSTVGLAMVASVMWTSWRFTGRKAAGLAAGLLYGVFGHFLPYTEARQIATEAQEFGNMLVLPTAYFVYQAWTVRRMGYVTVSGLLLAAVGLIHPIALLNAAIAAVAATVAALLTRQATLPVFRRFVPAVSLAALATVAPYALGLLAGIPFLATTIPFLTASSGVSGASGLPVEDWLGWAAAAAYWLVAALRRDAVKAGLAMTAAGLLLGAVGIQELPSIGVRSLALSVRSGELVALALALATGLGAAALEDSMAGLGVAERVRSAAMAAAVSLAGLALGWGEPPVPLASYTMDPDVTVAEFEHIVRTFPRDSWLVVSADDYALAANQGYQINPSVWVKHVPARARWPVYRYSPHRSAPIYQHRVFIFVPRRLSLMYGEIFAQWQIPDQRQLADERAWVRHWQARHGPLPVYFANRQLVVYELVNPSGGEE